MLLKYFFFILFLGFFYPLTCQENSISHNKISVENGLSNRFAHCTFQDRKGYIWIGTSDGLNKYDGKNITQYKENNSTISIKYITKILEDRSGNLILLHEKKDNFGSYTYQEATIFNPYSESSEKVNAVKLGNASYPLESISYISSNLQREIIIGTIDGKIYNGQWDDFDRVELEVDGPIKRVYQVDNYISIQTNRAIILYEKYVGIINTIQSNQRILLQRPDADANFYWFENNVNELQIYKSHNFIQIDTFALINGDFSKVKKQHLGSYPFADMHTFDCSLWIESADSLLMIKPDKSTIRFDKSVFEPIKSPLGGYINLKHIYFSRNGDTWISTTDGVHQLSITENHFNTLLPAHSTRVLTSINDSILLFTSQFGLHQVEFGKSNDNLQSLIEEHRGLCYYTDQDTKTIWLISGKNSIHKIDYSTPGLKITNEAGRFNSDNEVGGFAVEKIDNKLIISSSNIGGLVWYDIDANRYDDFTEYGAFTELKNSTIFSLFRSSDSLFIGSEKGLFLYKEQEGIIQSWTQEKYPTVPFKNILSISKDKSGNLLLSTKGYGLIILSLITNKAIQYNENNGLSDNTIYTAIEDGTGYLWLPSNRGLMRLQPNNNEITHFMPKDGIAHEEFNRSSYYQSPNGQIYLGGIRGITYFDPVNFSNYEQGNIQLEITNFKQFNGKKNTLENKTNTLVKNQMIHLQPKDQYFILSFSRLDFNTTANPFYKYKIDGLDTEWTYTKDASIRINKLPAGRFTMHLSSRSGQGKWDENSLRLMIYVEQVWYKTWWALLIWIALLCSMIYIVYKRKIHQSKELQKNLQLLVNQRTHELESEKKIIKTQTIQLKQLDKAKTVFFNNITHELRTPLTLISGPIKTIVEKDFEENHTKIKSIVDTVERNSDQLISLVNQILDLAKLENNTIELHEVNFKIFPFIDQIFSSYELKSNELNIPFSLDFQLPKESNIHADKGKLKIIVNNLISNAFKFSPEKRPIKLTIKTLDHNLIIELMDHGHGISTADLPYIFDRYYQSEHQQNLQGGTGIGLALVKQLVVLMDGEIQVQSTLDKSTTFTVVLPFIQVEKSLIDSQNNIGKAEMLPIFRQVQENVILLVEDNKDMVVYISSLLEDYYTIIVAENGLEAKNLINTTDTIPSLIISDLMMPIVDGLDFYQFIKGQIDYQFVPFIMLTARNDEQTKLKALSLGVDDYITKPFSTEELIARVNNLVKNNIKRMVTNTLSQEESSSVISADKSWLNDLESLVFQNINSSQYGINALSYDLLISERQLHRRVKALTGLTPNKYIRELKLDRARKSLENKEFHTLAEVIYSVGFVNMSHFTKIYEQRFGKKPTSYF